MKSGGIWLRERGRRFNIFLKRHRVPVVATSSLLITALIVQQVFFDPNSIPQVEAAPLTTVRQEVNIINAYHTAASGASATTSAIVNIDPTKYSGATFYFEVVASTSAATNATIALVNPTTGATAVSVTANGTTYARYRSSSFSISSATDYKVRLNAEAVRKGIIAARIVILQNTSAISATQTQVEIGSEQTYTSGTLSPLSAPKYWKYDSTKWSGGTPTFYAEATYARTADVIIASSTTYTTSGTRNFTVPSNITGNVTVQLWGAGGAGGAATTNTNGSGSGGAGGQYAVKSIAGLAGLTKSVTVAATTTGGGGAGSTGADSTWDTNVVVAKGGAGGAADSGAAGTGSTANGVGDTVNAGGNGAAGVSAGTSGGGGEGGRSTGTGGNATGGTGGTGGDGGDGGAGRSTNGAGNPGFSPGGGGAGGRSTGNPNVNGGNGALGRAVISYNIGASATTTIVLQESDGTGDGFTGWSDKITIVSGGSASTPTRVRSSSFTPTTGRNYRIAVREGYNGATHAIYNAKIVVDQSVSAGSSITYPSANRTTNLSLCATGCYASGGYAQSIVSSGGILTSAAFDLSKNGSPTGNATIKLYEAKYSAGAYLPVGTAVATSDNLDVATLSTTPTATTVNFSGNQRYVMDSGTIYILAFEWSGGNTSNSVLVGADTTSPTDPGNTSYLDGTWADYTVQTADLVYTVNYIAEGSFITKLEPQYLLANKTLSAGTALQNYLTYWDSTEWTNSNNTYTHQVGAANNSTSVIEVNTAAGVQVSGSQVSSPDNVGVSSAMTMPASGNLDVKATTNNGDVYASQILVAVASDTTVPSPNPPRFSTSPAPDSTSQVSMTSLALTDAGTVQYYFTATSSTCGTNLGTGGTDSGWQSSASYSDSGLQVNKCYAYTIRGRDGAGNETDISTASTTYTLAATPTGTEYYGVGVDTLSFYVDGGANPSDNPVTYYAVRASSTDSTWNNKWVTTGRSFSATPDWGSEAAWGDIVLTNLLPNTRYDFEVVARNQNNVLTATSTRTGTTTLPDTSAPTPNPATFSSAPNDASGTSISMTATAGTDLSTPVSYNFDYTSTCALNNGTGGTDSGWQTSTSYTDSGLEVNKCYAYSVQSRDSLSNTGTASAASPAYTAANTPSAPTLSGATDSTFTITNNENGNPSNTEFAAQVTGTSPSDVTWQNKYIATDGTPSNTPVWMSDATMTNLTVTGLDFSTQYIVKVMARNGDNEVTASSTSSNITTNADSGAPTPNPATFSSDPDNDAFGQISMTATAASDPSTPISYYFAAVSGPCGGHLGTGGTDSGWQSNDTTYSDDGLQANKCYAYTVQSRDAASNTGTASAASPLYSSAAVPGVPTLVSLTDEAITLSINANNNPSINPTTYFALQISVTTDNAWLNQYADASGNPNGSAQWLTAAQLTNFTVNGLLPATDYTFRVKARNADNDETAFGSTATFTTSNPIFPKTILQGVRLNGARIY